MSTAVMNTMTGAIREAAHPLSGSPADYDPLLHRIAGAHFALLGEASHGTHEFYRERAEITRRLIEEQDFTAVAVEADWPDAYRVNEYVRGAGDPADPEAALAGFRRFPSWMWRNRDVLDFVRWLRRHNDSLPPSATKVGFYGLDLYSLYASIDAVIRYLDQVDPAAARRARARYACFDHFAEDSRRYGYSAWLGLTESCEREAVNQLVELRRRAAEFQRRDGQLAADQFFFAEQNARLVRNAEAYYRAMFQGRVSSWNLRDRHMAETLEALARHLGARKEPKIAVWEHNSHLGDARATEMGRAGELNVGQLVRERHGADCVLIGFSTYRGTVTAAADWGGPAERRNVRPALDGSYEALFHETGVARFLLLFHTGEQIAMDLSEPRLERAIGVIYRPESERLSHYFEAVLPSQFDAILHFDETRAVEPLERAAPWMAGEPPETYPTAI
jgi:erythromycin esterase-like protein